MTLPSILATQRLFLRPFEPSDAPALQDYLNHPDLAGRRYIPWKISDVLPISEGQVLEILDRWAPAPADVTFAIILAGSQKLIGHASLDWSWDPLCPGFSLVIAPDEQNQDYGTEVLGLIQNYLFGRLPANNIGGEVAEWNVAGIAFLLKHGFTQCGRPRRTGLRNGYPYDLISFDMLRSEWLDRKGAGDGAGR